MKSAEAKPAARQKAKTSKPFFTRGGDHQSFFVNRSGRDTIQTKLRIGKVNDPLEKEADSTAEKVMTRSVEPFGIQKKPTNSFIPVKPTVQAKCAHCDTEEKLHKKENEKEDPKDQKLQKKPIFESSAQPPADGEDDKGIQRKCAACEQEEPVQKSSDSLSEQMASPSIENSLNASKTSGAPLPQQTRERMESSFGADFSGVRVHNDSSAAQMNEGLHAQAFTHGNHIYFNSGKFDPHSKGGQHLLAHELTHTIQQGASVRRTEEGSSTKEPSIQKSDDDSGSFLDNVADLGSSLKKGVSDIAGDIKKGVSDIASDVKQGISDTVGNIKQGVTNIAGDIKEGISSLVQGIKKLVTEGTNWISNGWKSLKNFASNGLRSLTEGYNLLTHFMKRPLGTIGEAMINLDADIIEMAWQAFLVFANGKWSAFKQNGDELLQQVQSVWSGISGYVANLFARINSITLNPVFTQLPDFLQNLARSAISGFQSLWQQTDREWKDLFNSISNTVQGFYSIGDYLIRQLNEYDVQKIVVLIRKYGFFLRMMQAIVDDPSILLDPLVKWIIDKLKDAPTKFLQEIDKQIARNKAQKKIQNQGKVPQRTSLNDGDIALGVVRACLMKWMDLKLGKMIKDMLLSMIWPPATAKAMGEGWDTMIKDIKEVWNRLYKVDSLQDLWTNILHLTDIIVIIWRFLNTAAGLLYVYMALLLIIGGGILGAVFGAGAGVVPGLLVGAEAAGELGEVLLISFLAAEATNLGLQYLILATGLNTDEEQETSFNKIADSVIGLVTAGILALLSAIAARLASWIMGLVKSIFAKLKSLFSDIGEGGAKGGRGEPTDSGGKGDAGGDKDNGVDPNKKLEGEAELEGDPAKSGDKKRELSMDVDGDCEVCASPCAKIRKKYGGLIDDTIDADIRKITQDPNLTDAQKLEKLEPIEQKLADKWADRFDAQGNLKPNAEFKIGEFGYDAKTDAQGRLSEVHADELQLTKSKRLPHDPDTPGKLPGDHAGHMIGDRFGGSAELDNLVSQTSKINLSEFKKVENSWAEALSKNQKVTVDIEIKYNGTDVRPTEFRVRWTIDGTGYSAKFVN